MPPWFSSAPITTLTAVESAAQPQIRPQRSPGDGEPVGDLRRPALEDHVGARGEADAYSGKRMSERCSPDSS